MLDAADASRRRELQRRAYAPGGSLSDAEAEELRELDARVRDAPVAEPEPVVSPAWVPEPVEGSADGRVPEPVEGPADGRVPEPVEASSQTKPHRRIPLIPVLAVVTVLAGAVVGSFVFSRLGSTPMTAAQQKSWAKLETAGLYDSGSIHLLGSKYGASVWSATKQQGEVACVVLTRPESDGTGGVGCETPTQLDQQTPVQGTLNYTENGTDYVVWATVSDDIVGNPAVVIERRDANQSWDWRSQYSDAELKMVDTMVATGLDGEMLGILGYDGDMPVWMGFDQDTQQPCLLIVQDQEVHKSCSSGADPATLTIGGTTYGILSSDNSANVLSITRGVKG